MSRVARGCLIAVLTAFAAPLALAQAPLPRIVDYERLEIPEISSGSVTLRGLGRQFDLVLERNDALLHRLTATRRNAAARVELWKGTLAGVPSSWVRLTRRRGALSGVIWDGADMYAIEPYRAVAQSLFSPSPAGPDDGIIFRLTGSLTSLADVVVTRDIQPASAAKSISVVRSAPLFVPPVSTVLEVDVGLIADSEYARFAAETLRSDAMTELLSLANILDGLFLDQVGVRIRPAEIVVFDTEPDPFNSIAPATLLGEVEQFKLSNPTLTPLDLAHLVTARDLEAEIVGIANLGSVCDPARGVSLTQAKTVTALSALITAHEIGHNLGAPHDAEAGSACAATPRGFLMDPNVTGSDEFSQCSIDQMRPRIDAATCLTPVPTSDVSVTAISTRARVPTGQSFTAVFLLENLGADDVFGIRVVLQASPGAVLDESQFPDSHGLHCEHDSQSRTCTLDILRSGAALSVGLGQTAVQAGTVTSTASLTALNDSNPANNTANYSLEATPAVKLRTVSFDKSTEIARPGQIVNVAIEILNEGVVDATGVVMELVLPHFFELASATLPQGGVCAQQWARGWNCPVGTMPMGQPQVVDLRLRTLDLDLPYGMTTPDSLSVRLLALEEDANSNLAATTSFDATQVLADAVLTVNGPAPGMHREVNVFSLDIENLGPDPVPSMRLMFSNSGLVIDRWDAPGTSCTIEATSHQIRCDVGPMASGETRTISISGLAPTIGGFDVAYSLSVDAYSLAGSHFQDEYEWIVLRRVAPSPPAPDPQPAPAAPAQTGGGGGGALDPISVLLALVAGAFAARRRRESQPRPISRRACKHV